MRALLPRPLAGERWLPIALAGLVDYRGGPVGPYRELFAAPMMVRGGGLGGHVPFMAVDSQASVDGGRSNWALPKQLAVFDTHRGGRISVRGDGWTVALSGATRRRRIPVRAVATCAQLWPDERLRGFAVHFRGHARAATVEVSASDVPWIAPRRHLAVALSGTLHVLPPHA
jgi:hypothetical protein